MEIVNLLVLKERSALRQWLMKHHQTEKECWVMTYRQRRPAWDALLYTDVVEEALCFGWIDSTLKKTADGKLVQRLSPRRKNSHWTELNKRRCHDLEQRGLMTVAGRTALQRAEQPSKNTKNHK